MKSLTTPVTGAAMTYMFLVFAIAAPQVASAEPNDSPLRRFWADFGLGYGSLRADDSAPPGSGGGVSMEVKVGARLSRQWLVGLDLGGIGLNWKDSNYDPNNFYSNGYSQTLNHTFCVAQFEPKSDHGWWVGAGAGTTTYTNKDMLTPWGQQASGSGHGNRILFGYDWPLRQRMHINGSLSYESGGISLEAPFTGSFNYSLTVLAAHVSF
jgi:hypothetical protein